MVHRLITEDEFSISMHRGGEGGRIGLLRGIKILFCGRGLKMFSPVRCINTEAKSKASSNISCHIFVRSIPWKVPEELLLRAFWGLTTQEVVPSLLFKLLQGATRRHPPPVLFISKFPRGFHFLSAVKLGYSWTYMFEQNICALGVCSCHGHLLLGLLNAEVDLMAILSRGHFSL